MIFVFKDLTKTLVEEKSEYIEKWLRSLEGTECEQWEGSMEKTTAPCSEKEKKKKKEKNLWGKKGGITEEVQHEWISNREQVKRVC